MQLGPGGTLTFPIASGRLSCRVTTPRSATSHYSICACGSRQKNTGRYYPARARCQAASVIW